VVTAIQIKDVKAYEVAVPWKGVLLWAGGIHRYYADTVARTIFELYTDEGVVGIGEGALGKEVYERKVKPLILGEDPLNYEKIRRRLVCEGIPKEYSSGVEIACWDIIGKVFNLPVYRLLSGGIYRREVPLSAYVFFRDEEGRNPVTPDNLADHCVSLIRRFGFKTVKLKLGVYPPEVEVKAVREVRERVGEDIKIRIDPNGAWSLPTALNVVKALEDCNLEYVESPIALRSPISNHQRLRGSTKTPICADGVYEIDSLVRIAKSDAADVVMADTYGCGGIKKTMEWFRVASSFRLGVSYHSMRRLGVAHVAKLHVTASFPDMHHAVDAHYHQLEDDILEGGKMEYKGGSMTVPSKPGLGVNLDEGKIKEYELTEKRRRELEKYTAYFWNKYRWKIEHRALGIPQY